MRYEMNDEDGRGSGSGCGCGCRNGEGGMRGRMHGSMGMHMRGMGNWMMDGIDDMGPLHKERLIEKLKLYKEDLEAQAKFIARRIDEIQKGSSESEEKEE
ncbi:hypothetical protein M1373_02090 [Candidatus Marsarchaeota archaeon]|nr:hypothetical protein [Candidatus Marsarchaeota archaeon]MCL5404325.1 hypothetical protein [Candidatus Marsarchaeota archaeon]